MLTYTNIYNHAQNNINLLADTIANASKSNIIDPENQLAKQLKMGATLISNKQTLAQPRQIFFVGLGGFDPRQPSI